MKKIITQTPIVMLALALLIAGYTAANAQTFAPSRIATINSNAFVDEKTGVTRLVKAYAQLEVDFKPRRDGLAKIQGQIETLSKEIQSLQTSLNNPAAKRDVIAGQISAKSDAGSQLEIEFKRMQEDAKAAFERRSKEVIQPIQGDLGRALEAYAKRLNIDVVVDASKFDGFYVFNLSGDITKAFIVDYNAKATTP